MRNLAIPGLAQYTFRSRLKTGLFLYPDILCMAANSSQATFACYRRQLNLIVRMLRRDASLYSSSRLSFRRITERAENLERDGYRAHRWPRTEAQWEEYIEALAYRFTPGDEGLVDTLVLAGQTPGYHDAAYPLEGARTEAGRPEHRRGPSVDANWPDPPRILDPNIRFSP